MNLVHEYLLILVNSAGLRPLVENIKMGKFEAPNINELDFVRVWISKKTKICMGKVASPCSPAALSIDIF